MVTTRSLQLPPIAIYLAELTAIAFAYFVLAKFGLKLASINPSASPVWPPTGFALAMVLLRGHRVAPAVFIGALVANATTAGSLATSVAIAAGNVLEAVIGGYLIERWCGGTRAFDTPANVAKFALISIGPATFTSATIGVSALRLGGFVEPAQFGPVWTTWWMGDFASALLLAPVIVLWATSRHWAVDRGGLARSALYVAAAAAVGLLVFGPLVSAVTGMRPMGFLAMVPLLWAALFGGPRDTATVGLVLACIAVWGTPAGEGAFAGLHREDSFLLVSMFVVGAALPSLALSSGVVLHKQAEAQLRDSEGRLRAIVDTAIDAIVVIDEQGIVKSVNPATERIFNYTPSEVVGRNISMLMAEPHRSAHDGYIQRYQRTGQARIIGIGREVEGSRKGGKKFPVDLAVVEWFLNGKRYFTGIMRDVSERRKREEQVQLLLREVNHRAKNMLGVVQVIASQSAANNAEDFIARFSDRIQALAASQDLLVKSQWQGVDMAELARSQLAHFKDLIGERIVLHGPALRISAEAAQAIGMALHELATNAGKYGALSNSAGCVAIAWHIGKDGGDRFNLSWSETGGPAVVAPQCRGFGTTVIQNIPEAQLDANVTLDHAASGLSWRLACPAQNVLEHGDAVADQ